eukprot:1292780-Prymnesium_polylepis.1
MPAQVRSRRAAAMLLTAQRTAVVPRATSRRRALAHLGARTGTRTASVHSAQRALDELQPP